ncbi:MAG: NAD(+) diphosphatase [Chlamydiae bacterium]|jgi:NAD+ diphosphatase|nr:NAD(+) diphosphatase [Chlamydiota bacterium]
MDKIVFSSPKEFSYGFSPQGDKGTYWFIFRGEQLLVHAEKRLLIGRKDLVLQRIVYLGMLGEKEVFAAELGEQEEIDPMLSLYNLRELFGVLPEEQYACAGHALQLLHWDRVHTYCGCCGSPTKSRTQERCRECEQCGQLFYPKIAPVVMVLVRKNNQILLARSAHFPKNMYSVLAGYVDVGETLEQCVIREVYEEVGLQIENIRYFGSQPWPFSISLLVAFTCDWSQGELKPDPIEIEAAGWFSLKDLPEVPSQMSLARLLIDSAKTLA